MEKDLKKIGVMFMLLTAIVFGIIISLYSQSLLATASMAVALVACIIIAHYIITKKPGYQKKPHPPVEVMIILFADIGFGLFAGSLMAVKNPTLQLVTVLLVAICGFTAFYIVFLDNPPSNATEVTP
jgi:hypothetical protein